MLFLAPPLSFLSTAVPIHRYRMYVSVFISLVNLFLGRKRNVLRGRIDSCHFDIPQLFLGTIFFTTLIFLFTTISVFCLCFRLFHLLLAAPRKAAWSCLAALSSPELFAAALSALPGGGARGPLDQCDLLWGRPAPLSVACVVERYDVVRGGENR